MVASAVRAGYCTYSIDCFNDVDTAEKTLASFRLTDFDDKAGLEGIFKEIDIDVIDGVVIGSGFEGRPDVLSSVQQRLPLLANSPDVIQFCSDPQRLLSLFNEHDIAYPETRFSRPSDQSDNWLIKKRFTTGGGHIRKLSASSKSEADDYYQRYIEGQSFSVNFLANQGEFHIIGINRIWCSTAAHSVFSYGGAVSDVEISEQLMQEVERVLFVITTELGLRGLCGIDFILAEDDQVMVLDINPRPTATLELYDDPEGELFSAHIAVFEKNNLLSPRLSTTSNGHQVVYAQRDLVVPKSYEWPEWCVCRPRPNYTIAIGEPICTVLATGVQQEEIIAILQQRQQTILSDTKHFECSSK